MRKNGGLGKKKKKSGLGIHQLTMGWGLMAKDPRAMRAKLSVRVGAGGSPKSNKLLRN